jgi:HPt (histidine-containing phosphotransfer) domain-containing protein
MTTNELNNQAANICDLTELKEMMGGKNNLILGMIDTFLGQIREELLSINGAIEKINYPVIKNFAHTMKSTVSIMGIVILRPILQEMENLAAHTEGIEKIKELNHELNLGCKKAIEEMESERQNYI